MWVGNASRSSLLMMQPVMGVGSGSSLIGRAVPLGRMSKGW